ncbi:MAG: hypothetical protein AAF962_06660 [Actinomycetota bacterium]
MAWLANPGFWVGVALGSLVVFVGFNTVLAVLNVKPGVSRASVLFNSLRLFDPDLFTERGDRFRRRAAGGLLAAFTVLPPVAIALALLTS